MSLYKSVAWWLYFRRKRLLEGLDIDICCIYNYIKRQREDLFLVSTELDKEIALLGETIPELLKRVKDYCVVGSCNITFADVVRELEKALSGSCCFPQKVAWNAIVFGIHPVLVVRYAEGFCSQPINYPEAEADLKALNPVKELSYADVEKYLQKPIIVCDNDAEKEGVKSNEKEKTNGRKKK